MEDLEEEKNSGKWTTSFRLSGKAKGAVMNVSFGYVVVSDNNTGATRDNLSGPNVLLTPRQNSMALMERDINNSPSFTKQYSSQDVDEVKDLHEILPPSKSALARSIDVLCDEKFDEGNTYSPLHNEPELEPEPTKLDACCSSDTEKEKLEEHPGKEGKTCSPVHDKPEFAMFQENLETVEPYGYPLPDSGKENPQECEGKGFSIDDQDVEFSSNEQVKPEESIVKAIIDGYTVDTVLLPLMLLAHKNLFKMVSNKIPWMN